MPHSCSEGTNCKMPGNIAILFKVGCPAGDHIYMSVLDHEDCGKLKILSVINFWVMLVQEHLEICSYHDKEEYLEREWSKDIT